VPLRAGDPAGRWSADIPLPASPGDPHRHRPDPLLLIP